MVVGLMTVILCSFGSAAPGAALSTNDCTGIERTKKFRRSPCRIGGLRRGPWATRQPRDRTRGHPHAQGYCRPVRADGRWGPSPERVAVGLRRRDGRELSRSGEQDAVLLGGVTLEERAGYWATPDKPFAS